MPFSGRSRQSSARTPSSAPSSRASPLDERGTRQPRSCRGCWWAVGGVAEEGSGGVCPGGWSCPGDAVDHLDVPGSFGDFDVVSWAGEDEVVDVGGSAVGPGGDVVDFAEVAG